MSEKVILITGCGSGLGRSLATLAAERGHRVYAGTRFPSRLRGFFRGKQSPVPVKLDPADNLSVARAVRLIARKEKRIDVLINNAAYGLAGPMETIRPVELLDSLNVNLCGPLRCIKNILPLMRAQNKGWIINIGSLRGVMGGRFLGSYGSSKAALDSISESLRHELRGSGINVSVVIPGFFPSSFGEHARYGSDRSGAGAYAADFGEYLARVKACAAAPGDKEAAKISGAVLDMVESGKYVFRLIPDPATLAAVALKLRRPSELIHERLR